MPLPPVSVLTQPVTCYPAWYPRFAGYGGRASADVVASGCPTVNGNVTCDPAAMARAASARMGVTVSLEAYTLARYLASEVGSGPVAEKVAVAQAALNRVRYVEKKTGNILNLLLYRQTTGHPNRGYYGPIHRCIAYDSAGKCTAHDSPYGRWAATSRDPTKGDILIALGILSGEIDPGFNKGADDQNGPEGLKDPIGSVRVNGSQRDYWVGPLPGVDPWRTFLYRHIPEVDPASTFGKALIERGIQAMKSGHPNWAGLPTCASSWAPSLRTGFGAVGVIIGAAALAFGGVAFAKAWRGRQRMSLRGGLAGHRPYTTGREVSVRVKEITADPEDEARQRATADRVNTAAAKYGRRAFIADVARDVHLSPERLAKLLVPWQRLGWVDLQRVDMPAAHDATKVAASEVEGPLGVWHLIVTDAKPLGVTARRGPRTGAITVDSAVVEETVANAIRNFEPCHPDETENATRTKAGYLRPVHTLTFRPVTVEDAATGDFRSIPISLFRRFSTTGPLVTGAMHTETTHRGHLVSQSVVLRPRDSCEYKDSWRRNLIGTLTHELAHAADPGIIKRTQRIATSRSGSASNIPSGSEASYRAYLNDPVEVAANLSAVRAELDAVRIDSDDAPPFILNWHSDRWTSLAPFLTEPNKRRFYKMVARVRDQREERKREDDAATAARWAAEDAGD